MGCDQGSESKVGREGEREKTSSHNQISNEYRKSTTQSSNMKKNSTQQQLAFEMT